MIEGSENYERLVEEACKIFRESKSAEEIRLVSSYFSFQDLETPLRILSNRRGLLENGKDELGLHEAETILRILGPIQQSVEIRGLSLIQTLERLQVLGVVRQILNGVDPKWECLLLEDFSLQQGASQGLAGLLTNKGCPYFRFMEYLGLPQCIEDDARTKSGRSCVGSLTWVTPLVWVQYWARCLQEMMQADDDKQMKSQEGTGGSASESLTKVDDGKEMPEGEVNDGKGMDDLKGIKLEVDTHCDEYDDEKEMERFLEKLRRQAKEEREEKIKLKGYQRVEVGGAEAGGDWKTNLLLTFSEGGSSA